MVNDAITPSRTPGVLPHGKVRIPSLGPFCAPFFFFLKSLLPFCSCALNGPPFLILFISLPRREIAGGEEQTESKRGERK